MKKILLSIMLLFSIGTTLGQTKKATTTAKQNNTSKAVVEENKSTHNSITDEGPRWSTVPDEDNAIYTIAQTEVPPEFPGGQNALQTYIAKRVNLSNESNETIRIMVSFVIEKDGSLSDINTNSNGTFNRSEVIQSIKSMPKWLPAELNGKKVRCKYSFPLIYHVKQ